MRNHFVFRGSKIIGGLLSAGGGVCIAGALIINQIPVPVRFFIALFLAFLFAAAIFRHSLLRGKNAVRRVVLVGREWEVHCPQKTIIGRVVYRFISPLLTVFIVADGRQSAPIMAAADSMEKDAFRQLRVQLICDERDSAV